MFNPVPGSADTLMVSPRSPLARTRRCAAAFALLGLAACSSAAAAPAPSAPAYEPHPAVAIVDRLSADPDDRLPHLAGLDADEAVAALADLGLAAQVVAYDEGPVSAQYPEPGSPAPADSRVILWTGAPPAPPPPPRPEPEPSRDDPARAAAPDDAPRDGAEPPPARDPDPPPADDPPPGQEGSRTSPRRAASTEPGVVLQGLASWYGPGFAGRTTACGQRFDPGALTLATRELRCGTRVRITGPTGSTVEAVVSDWGPAEWTGRRFDLSRATFEAIHRLGAGVAPVTIEVLP